MSAPGHDPERLSRIAPTELRPGEDPVDRFVREAEAVQTAVTRVPRDGVPAEVARILAHAGAASAAVTEDLAALREAIGAAVARAGVAVHRYEDVAGDRDAVRVLGGTVTGCLAAVAATGSIVTGGRVGRGGALVAPVHVCIVERSRIFGGMLALFRALPSLETGSMVALQSGPSRTADIEKTLILGMHGPREVHVVLVDDA